jgi:hypothetical protein
MIMIYIENWQVPIQEGKGILALIDDLLYSP